jgi:uncharacterized protein (TIGR02266 family)
MSQPPQRRRDKRYRVRLPIRTRIGGRVQELVTEDVSFRGLFLHTSAPLPLRQLIRIEASLPPEGISFATHGMVVHSVPESGGRQAGCGVQFYGMGDERRLWERYIQHVQRTGELLPDLRSSGELPAAPEAKVEDVASGSGPQDGRRFHRFPVVLEVKPRDLDELFRMYSRDVSVGGMFLSTPREIDVGSELRLDIRHPSNESVFTLSAVVRRRSTQPLGLGVEFTELDDRRRAEFFDFIHAPIPTEELEDLELLEGE